MNRFTLVSDKLTLRSKEYYHDKNSKLHIKFVATEESVIRGMITIYIQEIAIARDIIPSITLSKGDVVDFKITYHGNLVSVQQPVYQ